MSTRNKTDVLLVEDDPAVRLIVANSLDDHGYDVVQAESCAEARRAFATARPHAAVLDYRLPDGDALGLLEDLHRADPDLPVVILTAHGSIELAVEAIQRGADHFLTKPADPEALAAILERCLASRRQQRRQRAADANRGRRRVDPFLGTSDAIRRLARRSRKSAANDQPVLIVGETGCGKGVLARWLHDNSPRAAEPFVDLNCAGLKPELLESELLGHEKGAFTGASRTKQGLVEIADRGTLFLDEIGDLDLATQPKLLKVLEEQSFRRLGGVREHRVDLRLIAASHQDLSQRVRDGAFRRDLYFRLNTLKLSIPPLRHRAGDVAALAEHLLERLRRKMGRPGLALSSGALEALARYRWPGNIRELRNLLENAVLLGDGDTVKRGDLAFETAGDVTPAATGDTVSLEELERRHIREVLEHEDGSVTRAIKILEIPRSSLYKKMKKYGIDPPRR